MDIRSLLSDLSVKWMDAWKNKDERFLRDLLPDEFRFYGASIKKEGFDKEEWLDLALKRFHLLEFECNCKDMYLVDEMAVVQCFLRFKAHPSMGDHHMEYDTFDIWVLKNGQWKPMFRRVESAN